MLTTLGKGRSGATAKGLHTANCYLTRVSSDDQFHKVRQEVFNACTEQGWEKNVSEGTVGTLERFRNLYSSDDPMAYMYPSCLWVCGHLHVLFNCLETAVKALPFADEFFNLLRCILEFLCDRDLRRKFQYSCLRGRPEFKLFDAQPRLHIDWRWEFLCKCLDNVLPRLAPLRSYFDVTKLCDGDTGTKVINKVKDCEQALRNVFFEPFGEMLRAHGKTLEKYAHALESCDCHDDVWIQPQISNGRRTAWNVKPERGLAYGKADVVHGGWRSV